MDARHAVAASDLSNVIANPEATLTSAFLRLVGAHPRASCSVIRRRRASASKVQRRAVRRHRRLRQLPRLCQGACAPCREAVAGDRQRHRRVQGVGATGASARRRVRSAERVRARRVAREASLAGASQTDHFMRSQRFDGRHPVDGPAKHEMGVVVVSVSVVGYREFVAFVLPMRLRRGVVRVARDLRDERAEAARDFVQVRV